MEEQRTTGRAIEARAWGSAITHVDAHRVYLRGVPVEDLLGRASFGTVLLLLWRGTLPSDADAQLLDACLVAAADHGPSAPSALAARTASSTRQAPIPSLAAGLLALTHYHGAGVSACMEVLLRAEGAASLDDWAQQELEQIRAGGGRIAGVGHRLHTRDMRSEKVLSLVPAPEGGVVAAVRALAEAVERHAGRPIPVNIDGALAAALCHLGLAPVYGDLLFAIARSGGIAAHVVEERTRERPMRTIDPTAVTYDGPAIPHPPVAAEGMPT